MIAGRFVFVLSIAIACAGCGSDGDDDSDVPGAVALTACADVTAPGRYVLVGDLTNDPGSSGRVACLAIHDTTDVTLDCGGHTVTGLPAVSVERVDGFRIENCRFASVFADPVLGYSLANPTTGVLRIRASAHGIVTRVAIGPPDAIVFNSHDIALTDSELDATYYQFASQRVRVANNRMTNPFTTGLIGALFWSSDGVENAVVDNTIDGKWNGIGYPDPGTIGADDGILLFDERDMQVSGNVIRDVWDCGIENVGLLADSTFEGNTITNAGICGIGGWYWSSVRNDVFKSNTVVDSPLLFYFYRLNGLRPARELPGVTQPADERAFFEGNRFEGNRFELSAGRTEPQAAVIALFDDLFYGGGTGEPDEREPGPADFALTGNVFVDNDFGRDGEPVLFGEGVVPGLVIDGGGNRCRQPAASDYPLRCE